MIEDKTGMLFNRLRSALANAVDLLGDVPEVDPMKALLQEVVAHEAAEGGDDPQTIQLGDKDSALVFRNDGEEELYAPGMEEGEDGPEAPDSFVRASFAAFLLNSDRSEALFEEFLAATDDLEEPPDQGEAPPPA